MNNDLLVISEVICQRFSLANHPTRDQKSLFTVTHALFFIFFSSIPFIVQVLSSPLETTVPPSLLQTNVYVDKPAWNLNTIAVMASLIPANRALSSLLRFASKKTWKVFCDGNPPVIVGCLSQQNNNVEGNTWWVLISRLQSVQEMRASIFHVNNTWHRIFDRKTYCAS